jgi:cytochrome b6-f complex iron-sulfur subunit
MQLNRRTFLILGATFAAGCAAPGGANPFSGKNERVINAGPASQYLTDGVYTRYGDLGFFIVRRGATLFALSAICTHRKCKLAAEPDRSFYCKCHGSTFDPAGHVTQGPARRDLPVFSTTTDEQGQLMVTLPVL